MNTDNIKPITVSDDFNVTAETHIINVSMAKEVGLIESLVLSHFYYWHQCNNGNAQCLMDNKVWFFVSISQICEIYPYLSSEKIKRAIERLVISELIYKRSNETHGLKKANWYALSDKVLSWYTLGKIPNDGYNTQRWVKYPTKDNNIEVNKIYKKEGSIEESILPKKDLDFADVSSDYLPIVNTWLQYKKEKKQPYTKTGFKTMYNKLVNMSGGNADIAKQIVEQSMANNWAGLFPLKNIEPIQQTMFDDEVASQKEQLVINRMYRTLSYEDEAKIYGIDAYQFCIMNDKQRDWQRKANYDKMLKWVREHAD